MSDVVKLTRDLVAIDSRNTLPIRHRDRPSNEEGMANFLEPWLAERGFSVERQYVAPDRPALVALRMNRSDGATVAFEAHMDTVGVEGMTIPPFDAEERDGRLYGRGTCDTKGGMAAMLTAIEELPWQDLPINIVFIAGTAEETGCEGAPLIDLTKVPIDWIVVAEPTSNQPVTSHKAKANFELICRGKAAHGSRPEAGCNAIYRMSEVIQFLRENIIPELAAHEHPWFDGSTISVGTIRGGVKANIVPDECAIVVDLRLVSGYGALEETMTRIASCVTEALGFPVELGWHHSTPGLDVDRNSKLVQAAVRARKRLGLETEIGAVNYCTDAGVFAAKGYPSIVLGPGDILQAHGAVEYVNVQELREAVDIYKALVFELADHHQ